jgi:hypothetical protein
MSIKIEGGGEVHKIPIRILGSVLADHIHISYHYEEVEQDPMHPGDNNPGSTIEAICDDPDCPEPNITAEVGEYDPEFDPPIGESIERDT